MRKVEKIECATCKLMAAKPEPYDSSIYVKYCTWGKAKTAKRLHKPRIWKHCTLPLEGQR